MRKKGIYILVVALLAWSCRKEEIPAIDSSCPIAFSMLSTGSTPSTKADTYTYFPTGTSFTVAARKSAGSTWNSSNAAYVFNTTNHLQNVQTTNATGTCTYSPAAYWSGNSVFRFRAVYPVASTQVNYTDDLDGNAVISNFTVNATGDSQKDLMLSDLVERTVTTVGDPAPVDIVFHHLLCKVIVQIGEETNSTLAPNASLDEFTITGVSLNGLPKQGTYTYTGTSNTWNPANGNWSLSGSESLTCVNNNSSTLANDGTYTTVFDGLLLIPMTISNMVNGVNMVVNYTVTHDDGDPTTPVETSTPRVSIPIPPITWEAGKVYTYQLKMSEEYYIRFGNITVDTWGNPQSSGTVIIK